MVRPDAVADLITSRRRGWEASDAWSPNVTWHERIVIDPAILAGKPVVQGTRLAVELIVGLVARGWAEQRVLDNYPGLTRDDSDACLVHAAGRRGNK